MNHDKIFLIINPRAKAKHQRRFTELVQKLDGTHYDFAESRNAEDITKICRKALENGYKRIFAVGGDGTFSLCIQAFMQDGHNRFPEATLTPLPFGTGNDFYAALPTQGETTISLGCFKTADGTDRYFANSFSTGITPKIIQNYSRSKLRSYLFATLRSLLNYTPDLIKINAKEKPTLLFLITKGPFVGGGMRFHKDADHITSRTKAVWIPSLSPLKILKALPRIYQGGIESIKEVESFDVSEPVQLTFKNPTNLIEADGELYEVSRDITITLLPRCIRILHGF